MSRRLILSIVGAITVLAAVIALTWTVARLTQSPAQREAAAAAPSSAPILVAVSRGNLTDQITVNATLQPQATRTVALPSGEDTGVVTARVAEVGSVLSAGQVLLRVNSRPVLVLPGAFPAYRDLNVGDRGDDVRQLQEALQTLGYRVSADGNLGAGTAKAVAALYRRVGASAPTAATSPSAGGASASGGSTDQSGATATAPAAAAHALVLPRSEVLFVADLASSPTLHALPEVGTKLSERNAQITISSGAPTLQAEVPATTANSLKTGAQIHLAIAGRQVSGHIESITAKPAKSETDTGSGDGAAGSADAANAAVGAEGATNQGDTGAPAVSTFIVTFATDESLPAPGDGQQAPFLVAVDRTKPLEDVLLVPKRAIVTSASRQQSVLKAPAGADGKMQAVTVTVKGCVAGQCAIEGPLKEGDKLQVNGS